VNFKLPLFLLIFSPLCFSQEWKLIEKDSDGKIPVYVDTLSIERNESLVEFSILQNYPKTSKSQGKIIKSFQQRIIIDCVTNKKRTLYSLSFSEINGTGSVVFRDDFSNEVSWEKIKKNTLLGIVGKKICKKDVFFT
jgi:hypothetical protein